MPAAISAPPSWLFVILAAQSVLLVCGLLVILKCRSTNRHLKVERTTQCNELEAMRKEIQDQAAILTNTEREVARLKRIPKAELLPMLQLTHELRSPLAAVQNSLEMILQGYTKNDPKLYDEMLTLAQDRTKVMLARVNDFLRLGAVKYAEIERKPRQVQLLDVLERLSPEMRVRARWEAVNLHLDVPDSLPPVIATHEDLEHLLSNLVNNAIKYTHPGGTVTVSLQEKDGNVVGIVEDTGIGIAPDEVEHIFDEFYRTDSARTKAHGTGLGLSIVKRVIDLYDGHIHVESKEGQGSKFIFAFPAVQTQEAGQ